MSNTEVKLCDNHEPHGAHHTIVNIHQDGEFHHREEINCPGVVDATELMQNEVSLREKVEGILAADLTVTEDVVEEKRLRGAIAQVVEMDEGQLDEVLDDAEERRQAEREIAEYMEKHKGDHVDLSDIRAKDPELQAKMDAYQAQAERLQHQAYLQQLREAAEKGEIKEYPNRKQRRANAKAYRKANK